MIIDTLTRKAYKNDLKYGIALMKELRAKLAADTKAQANTDFTQERKFINANTEGTASTTMFGVVFRPIVSASDLVSWLANAASGTLDDIHDENPSRDQARHDFKHAAKLVDKGSRIVNSPRGSLYLLKAFPNSDSDTDPECYPDYDFTKASYLTYDEFANWLKAQQANLQKRLSAVTKE